MLSRRAKSLGKKGFRGLGFRGLGLYLLEGWKVPGVYPDWHAELAAAHQRVHARSRLEEPKP